MRAVRGKMSGRQYRSVSVGTCIAFNRYGGMTNQRDRLYGEAAELWMEVYGEAPPVEADPSLMLEILLRELPEVSYRRLHTATRAQNLVWPVDPGRGRYLV